jgi:16S rRNA (uracil1498-N3)-methyltransferase
MAPHSRRMTRLFVERELTGDALELDDREAHYLGHVLRLGRGDDLVAFNGRGSERQATVRSLQRRGALLELRDSQDPLPEPSLELTLVQALTKSDAMDLVVQKATELGVRSVQPIYTEFSVVRLDAERSERRLEHWRKIAQSACEQCGRHAPPRIEPPLVLADGLAALTAPVRLALDPAADAALRQLAPPSGALAMAIGPEGGFSPLDWRRLDAARFARVSLGPRVLRAETAAIAACAIVQSLWGDLGRPEQ